MAWIGMVVLFIAKTVAVWGVFIEKGGALSKVLSADIFGLGEVQSCNFAQMFIVSGTMNRCIGAPVHLSVCP